MIESDVHDGFAYPDVISVINKKFSVGVTPEEYEEYKDVKVSSVWTVKNLVKANKQLGLMREINGKITTTTHPIKINLSTQQRESLSASAQETDQTITAVVSKIVDQHFVTKPDEGQ